MCRAARASRSLRVGAAVRRARQGGAGRAARRRDVGSGVARRRGVPSPRRQRAGVAVVAGANARRPARSHTGRAMTHWRLTRVAAAAVGSSMIVVGRLALFTWDPTPTWPRWTLGTGAALLIPAVVLRQPAG